MWCPKYFNCLFWAHWQRWKYGGYVARRRSMYGWWYHRLWSPDLVNWYAYSPYEHHKHITRKLLFKGYIEVDDAKFKEIQEKLSTRKHL